MTLQIGRILGLNEPMAWSSAANHAVVSGIYQGASVADTLQRRDQLLGYNDQADGDEPAIPIVVASEPRLNGFWKVMGVAVTTDPTVLAQGLLSYTLDLESVFGFTQPIFESIMTNGLLTPNVVGAVAADAYYWHAVPASTIEYWSGVTGTTLFSRSSADGNLRFMSLTATPPTAISFALTPASCYIGAAKLEQGTTLQPVVGRQVVQQDVLTMRLSNGLVRVTANAVAGKMDVSHFNGSTWSALKTYSFTLGTGGLVVGFADIAILRNSPEEVIIRLGLTPTNSTYNARIFLDLALRRGDRLVRGYVTSDIVDTLTLARNVTEAATAIAFSGVSGGGIRATANDGDTNRYVLLSYQQAVTTDLVNGKLTVTAATKQADFAVGSEVGGSGAVNPDDAISLAKQYLAAQSEKQLAVSR